MCSVMQPFRDPHSTCARLCPRNQEGTRPRQEDSEFKTSLNYIVRHYGIPIRHVSWALDAFLSDKWVLMYRYP